jgi:replicative DNA helicase
VLPAEEIFFVEGEKDADVLASQGVLATTIAGGANAPWHPDFTESLTGKRVIFLPDNDPPGKQFASRAARELKGRAAEFVIVDLPVPLKGDVSDYFEAGHTVEDLQALVTASRRRIRIDQLNRRGLLSPKEIIETIDGGVRALMKPPKGLPTGFPQFDNVTMGLHPGELVILAARPAMGKTALALNIADFCAFTGKAVAVFSLEMSRASLLRRMLCSRARVNQMRLRAGVMDHDERQRFSRALTELADTRLRIDDTPLTIAGVKQRLACIRERLGLDLVIVDYLQLMPTGEFRDSNRNNEVGFLSRELKLLAGELNVPFLVLSQLSRKPEERKNDHRPQLADLRDSGEIEQNADVVTLLYRPEYYDRNKPELRGKAELIIAKHRNGPTEDIELRFYREQTRFEDLGGEDGRCAA